MRRPHDQARWGGRRAEEGRGWNYQLKISFGT